jgi:hypothetical protein
MKKYPWDQEKEIDWDAPWPDIANQYADRYFESTNNLIDYYFKAQILKMACIAGWCISAILFICLVVVTQ